MIIGFVSRPALWFSLLALPFIILGTSTLIIAGGMYFDRIIDGWIVMSTAAFLFFFLGAHLFSMGIIGELLMKTGDYLPKNSLRSTQKFL